MAAFPFLHHAPRQQKIRALAHLARYVDDARRADEAFHGDVVRRIVRVVFARDPVDGCVEMRTGMLPATDVVPIPGGAARVVARDLVQGEWLRGSELRRQLDRLRRGIEGHREIDHADAASKDAVHQSRKGLSMRSHACPLALRIELSQIYRSLSAASMAALTSRRSPTRSASARLNLARNSRVCASPARSMPSAMRS